MDIELDVLALVDMLGRFSDEVERFLAVEGVLPQAPRGEQTRAAIWSLVEWLTRWPWGPGAYGAIDRLVVAGAIVDELARESAP